mgnify:CR=1 FL=1
MEDKVFITTSCGLAYRAKEDDLYLIWQRSLLVENKPEEWSSVLERDVPEEIRRMADRFFNR